MELLDLKLPFGGLWKRTAFQRYGVMFTPACNNVWPDDPILGRERFGSRPGMSKAYAQQLGSGEKIYGLGSIEYQNSGTRTSKLLAISNGTLYQESTALTTMTAVSSSLTLASSYVLQIDQHNQLAYIADYGPILHDYTDGVVASTNQFTSASAGSFSGVNANDYVVVMTGGGTGTGATGGAEVQTITISGTPTGGTFVLTLEYGGSFYHIDNIPYNASAANVQTRINGALGDSAVACGGGSLPGTPVTVTFSGTGWVNKDIALFTADDAGLTGGTVPTVTVAETTKGGGTVDADLPNGVFTISSIVGSTITLGTTTQNATGISFYITRALKKYDPVANTLTVLTATDGHVPQGCPLLCHWNDRLVVAGGTKSPNNVFLSRQGDVRDWDYSVVNDAGAAIALSTGLAGQLGQPITAIWAHSDDCLIIGCTTSLWILRGDPGYGGRLDRLSPEIGVIGPNAYCYTPEGICYFMSQDGIYQMNAPCGSVPRSISRELLPESLLNISSTDTVSMAYSVRYRGIYVFVSPSTAASPTHYFIDVKMLGNGDSGASAAFFPMTVPSNCDAFTLHAKRDMRSDYDTVMIGCRDGYIRRFDRSVKQDDGTNFSWYFDLGPINLSDGYYQGLVGELVATLGSGSGPVNWALRVGDSAEQAFNATATASGTFTVAGMNPTERPRLSGGACVLRLSNKDANTYAAFESLVFTRDRGGKLRL